ncbi:16S rRNA (cytidine(1402)-2'-O)-methyltransferase [Chitinibacter sp. GC72]|uniref:16S rRNA (cytidine(1402)-2'-O)-methyltransferase n=1 Tax=Chitinibacter sp. GC72 TaxID=1526917 RepID=UPI001E64B3E7|nr:16S rRNA (cytidine(1402)-2'-O)-methyltransferase [Chitinibacter sp. GC72]
MHKPDIPVSKSALYVVATPIGNLGDITERALAVLKQADVIAAEDTRVTGQLLKQFGISTPMISVREHNERTMAEKIVARLAAGDTVAQVSDAGTPAVSDPGAVLAAAVHAAGFAVIPVPGASALTSALSASGFSCAHSLFYGFLPPKSKQRLDALTALRQLPYLTVFYEAPHRIAECVADMATVFGGEREAVLARELTKTYETIRRAPLAELAQWIASDSNQQRGEAVIVVDAAAPEEKAEGSSYDSLLTPLLAELPLKQAVSLAQAISGAPRNALYERALALKNAD